MAGLQFPLIAAVVAAGLLAAIPAAVYGSSSEVSDPRSLRLDMIAVADTDAHTIRVFHSNGTPAFAFGSEGSGDGQFSSPEGVAVYHDGTIAVADTGNNRVQVFVNGTFAGTFGSSGAGIGQLDGPRSIRGYS